jgi:hypothetical protein
LAGGGGERGLGWLPGDIASPAGQTGALSPALPEEWLSSLTVAADKPGLLCACHPGTRA